MAVSWEIFSTSYKYIRYMHETMAIDLTTPDTRISLSLSILVVKH